jgi:hypothetical protein
VPLYVEFRVLPAATHEVDVRDAKTIVELPAPGRVAAVTLDPLYHVHHMTPEIKADLLKSRRAKPR